MRIGTLWSEPSGDLELPHSARRVIQIEQRPAQGDVTREVVWAGLHGPFGVGSRGRRLAVLDVDHCQPDQRRNVPGLEFDSLLDLLDAAIEILQPEKRAVAEVHIR